MPARAPPACWSYSGEPGEGWTAAMNCTVWRCGRPCRSTALNTADPVGAGAWGAGASAGPRRGTAAGRHRLAATSAAGAGAPAPPAVAAAIAACGAMPYFGRTTPVTELGE